MHLSTAHSGGNSFCCLFILFLSTAAAKLTARQQCVAVDNMAGSALQLTDNAQESTALTQRQTPKCEDKSGMVCFTLFCSDHS